MSCQHICFITTGDMRDNAIAKRALGLSNYLHELGWKVSILLQDTPENRHRAGLECNNEINIFYFPKTNVLKEILYKEKIVRRLKPDFLYTSAFVTRDVVGLGMHVKKIVEHCELQSGIENLSILRRVYCLCFEYASLFYADYIVNASKYLEEVFMKRAVRTGRNRLPMLYLPYAFNYHLSPTRVEDKSVHPVTFVFLGTMIREYGIFTILEAARILRLSGREFRLNLLGKGAHYEKAKIYIASNHLESFVDAPGFVQEEEIDSYFSQADAFISPMNDTVQDWARCPSKLYMYLPYRKPIITCRIGEPAQVLGEEGIYYLPGDAADLARKMEIVLDGGREKINIDISAYTWQENARILDDFIK